MKRLLILILPVCLLTAGSPPPTPPSSNDTEHYLSRFVDPTVSPRDDFFQYAAGKWLKLNPIPSNERLLRRLLRRARMIPARPSRPPSLPCWQILWS
jgi:hypothetical protein